MYTTSIKLSKKYDYLAEKFIKAYEFLQRTDLDTFEEGSVEIDGKDVVANFQFYTTVDEKTAPFETHDKFFDIQFMIKGTEGFGYAKREDLIVSEEYDETRDITFYEKPEHSGMIILEEGDFIVVAPEDAHQPRCAVGEAKAVKKIVVKVRV
ncbi:MAG: YhcH/YjgK/YiaL family protein [Lachnospiraceae bacterium]